MLAIPGQQLRQLRHIFERFIGRAGRGTSAPAAVFQTTADCLTVGSVGPAGAIEYRLPGAFEPAAFAVPLAALAECESRSSDPVRLGPAGDDRLQITWQAAGVPRCKQVECVDRAQIEFPPVPESLRSVDARLLPALREASAAADRQASRYALACIQLRGQTGQVVATDGRQLLLQGGFEFPWSEDLLVPASLVFSCRELQSNQAIQIGRSDKHVTLVVGPWTMHLAINTDGRFPAVDSVVPAPSAATSRLALHPSDAEFLLATIGHLPGDHTLNHPVTLDLNGQVVVRARSEDDPRPTDVVLSNTTFSGEPLRLSSNREFLARALRLGFRNFHFYGSQKPVLASDGQRQYVWMLLDEEGVLGSAADPVLIASPIKTSPIPAIHKPPKESKVAKSTQATAQAAPVTSHEQDSSISPIDQAVALRDALHLASRRAHELTQRLKRQQRQDKLVASTLASLRQLQSAG